jgi:hypothetical protein
VTLPPREFLLDGEIALITLSSKPTLFVRGALFLFAAAFFLFAMFAPYESATLSLG